MVLCVHAFETERILSLGKRKHTSKQHKRHSMTVFLKLSFNAMPTSTSGHAKRKNRQLALTSCRERERDRQRQKHTERRGHVSHHARLTHKSKSLMCARAQRQLSQNHQQSGHVRITINQLRLDLIVWCRCRCLSVSVSMWAHDQRERGWLPTMKCHTLHGMCHGSANIGALCVYNVYKHGHVDEFWFCDWSDNASFRCMCMCKLHKMCVHQIKPAASARAITRSARRAPNISKRIHVHFVQRTWLWLGCRVRNATHATWQCVAAYTKPIGNKWFVLNCHDFTRCAFARLARAGKSASTPEMLWNWLCPH